MKTTKLAILMLVAIAIGAKGDAPVENPKTDFAAHEAAYGRVIYEWDVDLNNDGKTDVLLDVKLTEDEREGRGKNYDLSKTRWFTTYLSIGNQYIVSPYDQPEIGQVGEIIAVKLDECYVGNISEIVGYGIVTIERYDELMAGNRAFITIARIYAYTVNGYVVKKTKLAEFSGSNNAIYDKYLAVGKRTAVVLKEVTVPAP